MQKYEILFDDDGSGGTHRIRALKNFADVKAGDIGGYVSSYKNLSQEDECWIYDNSIVKDEAKVSDNAKVYGNATIHENAAIYANAQVFGNADIYGKAQIFGNAKVYDNVKAYDNCRIFENAIVCGDIEVCDMAMIHGLVYLSYKTKISGALDVFNAEGINALPKDY